MRAARYYGVGDIRLEDVTERDPVPGEVKVKVAYNGICGTDLHEYYDAPMMVPVSAPHPRTGAQVPVILGHEACGTVVETGAGVNDLPTGTLVAIEPIGDCGACRSCAHDLPRPTQQ